MFDETGWQSRTELILGNDSCEILKQSHVLVVGLGGVGGLAAELIARTGIGEMTIADGDIVDNSNRNRQIAALTSTCGMKKADVMAKRLTDINPSIKLHVINEYLTEEKMEALIRNGNFSAALDAIDTLGPKVRMAACCVRCGIPLVSSMGAGAHVDPEQILCRDISKTEVCPLAKAVRTALRKEGISKGFLAVFSKEPPIREAIHALPPGEGRNKRSITGTISFMPSLFACHCTAALTRLLLQPVTIQQDISDVPKIT